MHETGEVAQSPPILRQFGVPCGILPSLSLLSREYADAIEESIMAPSTRFVHLPALVGVCKCPSGPIAA